MARPKAVDWAAIESEYRAGITPLRKIGSTHGVSDVAILKRARKEGWERNLKARIRAKAENLVSKAVVSTALVSKKPFANEAQVVDLNAAAQAAITIEHRADVRRARATVQSLMGELETYGIARDDLEALAEVAACRKLGEEADKKTLEKAIDAMLAGSSFPARVGAAHKLADALVKCVTLERVVAGISDDDRGDTDLAAALKRLAATPVPDQPVP